MLPQLSALHQEVSDSVALIPDKKHARGEDFDNEEEAILTDLFNCRNDLCIIAGKARALMSKSEAASNRDSILNWPYILED